MCGQGRGLDAQGSKCIGKGIKSSVQESIFIALVQELAIFYLNYVQDKKFLREFF